MSEFLPIIVRQEMSDNGIVRLFVEGSFPDKARIASSFLDHMQATPHAVLDGDELRLTFENGAAVYRLGRDDGGIGYREAHLQWADLRPEGAA